MKFIEVEQVSYDNDYYHNSPIYINVDDISYVMSTGNIAGYKEVRTIVMKDGIKHTVADKYRDIINKLVNVNIKSNREDTDNDWK